MMAEGTVIRGACGVQAGVIAPGTVFKCPDLAEGRQLPDAVQIQAQNGAHMLKSTRSLTSFIIIFVLTLILGVATVPAHAQTETVLYPFAGSPDGVNPYGALLMDKSGNLFGTTYAGGTDNYGTVFELVNNGGSYTEKILYSFQGALVAPTDGLEPEESLVMDSAGDLYGTTYGGGANGYGTVFELVNSSGSYTETVLYGFQGTSVSDGAGPQAGLLRDATGNLFGTTRQGGDSTNDGTVFELAYNSGSGSYTESVLYTFLGPGSGDGSSPAAGLIMDSSGNLYGTTEAGGTSTNCGTGIGSGCGTVFELLNSSGSYSEKLLHSFQAVNDGSTPVCRLLRDSSGNLFGTTELGGASNLGTVFELANSSGSYTESVLYSFAGASDGVRPQAGLVADASGDLFGTTVAGGANSLGTVFELVNSSGSYNEQTQYSFAGSPDGNEPYGSLILDSSGNLYGTTRLGGGSNAGTVFEVTPAAGPAVSFSPSSLSFGTLVVGTPSSEIQVTVTNSGSADLTFAAGAVTVSGTNKNDFAVTTDTCSGTTVSAGKTCTAGVTFTPSAASSESASLEFADNATGSPQSVALSGTGVAATPGATLSPSSLDFGGAVVDSTTSAKTVTLSNGGNTQLAITSITASSGFAESDDCAGTVDAGKSCSINVTFKPTAAGAISGTLTVNDNASTGSQTVSLSGTGEDYTIGSSSSSDTVTAGQSATLTVTITPEDGFNQAVTISCAGAPQEATCTASPSSVTPDGTNAAKTTLTITTTAHSAMPPPPGVPQGPQLPLGWLLLALLSTMALAGMAAVRRLRVRTALGLAVFCLILCAGCDSKVATPTNTGTPVGTYTLTVSGSSGSVSHSTSVTLTVN